MNKQEQLTPSELQAARAELKAKVEEATKRECNEYHSAFTGLVKCPCKPLVIITYQALGGDCVSGEYCTQHALELRRNERLGKLEILSDESIYHCFPAKGQVNK